MYGKAASVLVPIHPADCPRGSPHLKAGSGGQLPANLGQYIPLYNDQAEVSGESTGFTRYLILNYTSAGLPQALGSGVSYLESTAHAAGIHWQLEAGFLERRQALGG
jgi:hypothetical protein